MDQVVLAQGGEGGLGDADVTLHAAEDDGVAVSGKTLEGRAEYFASEAGEDLLLDGGDVGEEGGDFGDGVAESLGILRGEERGDFEDSGEADEELGVADELLFLKDRREKFFLDVDDDEGGALGLERAEGDFGVVGVGWGDGA